MALSLLDIFHEHAAISDDVYQELADTQLQPGELIAKLLEHGARESVLRSLWAQSLGVPFVELEDAVVDQHVLTILSKEQSLQYGAVPYMIAGGQLFIAMVDPGNYEAVNALSLIASQKAMSVVVAMTTASSLAQMQARYDMAGGEFTQAIREAQEVFAPSQEDKDFLDFNSATVAAAPVSRIVTMIMRHAVETHASDIHIEPFSQGCRVRYRIDGVLMTSLSLPGNVLDAIVTRVKVISGMKLDENRVPQDGRITDTIAGDVVDFRVSTLPLEGGGEKVVMRVLDTSDAIPTLSSLGFRSQHQDAIAASIKKPFGLFLVTGPTGAGKSTTLYTILSMLNTDGVNIVTLEDPIEYTVKGVNQSQVRPEVGYTFASGLRSLLRQDPNIIMVGEIRDGETAELVVHAALTGHLILTTIHTNDSFGVVPRLIDMGVEPFLLSSVLNTVVAQRLARRICPHCKEEVVPPADIIASTTAELALLPLQYALAYADKVANPRFYHGTGCEYCNGTGYKGRVAVAEIFEATDALKHVIMNGYKDDEVRKVAHEQAMISLRADGLLKVLDGETTLEEIMRVSKE